MTMEQFLINVIPRKYQVELMEITENIGERYY